MNKIPYKSSPAMDSEKVTHAFLGKIGGVSTTPFSSLNISTAVGDEEVNVNDNIELLSIRFGFRARDLTTVKQIHGNEVLVLHKDDNGDGVCPDTEADAIITDQSWLPIGVLTADCVPIILHDPIKKAVGVVHAGWRGTLTNIAKDTIETMRAEFDSEPADILAAIGPSIGSCCFEVSDEIAQDFITNHGGSEVYLSNKHLNLPEVNALTLIKAGLAKNKIDKLGICTVCDEDNYFSHRRDNGNTGRQLSFAMIKE
jgi:hypothetical protein